MRRLNIWQIGLIMLGIIVLAGLTTIGVASSSFRTDFSAVSSNILSNSVTKQDIVTEADLADLPDTVQRYLLYTSIIGKEKINTVRLKQKGTLRQTPDDSWKNITAVEYFSVDPPAFVWMGKMAAGPFSIISARDSYLMKMAAC